MKQKILFIILWMLYQGSIHADLCTSRGKFPNQTANCRGYIMCISGPTGFMEYNLTCPDAFIYSHIENVCTNVTSYKCLPDFNCTGLGNFEADTNDNCTAFVACVQGIDGMADARWITCPRGTLFSSTKKLCVNETANICHKVDDSSNIFSVKVNNIEKVSGNFSFNNSSTFNSKVLFVFYFIILVWKLK